MAWMIGGYSIQMSMMGDDSSSGFFFEVGEMDRFNRRFEPNN